MKEKAYIKKYALSKEDRDNLRQKREGLKFNQHMTLDSFGPVPKDIYGNEYATVGLCSNTGYLYFGPKIQNEPQATLDNLKGPIRNKREHEVCELIAYR